MESRAHGDLASSPRRFPPKLDAAGGLSLDYPRSRGSSFGNLEEGGGLEAKNNNETRGCGCGPWQIEDFAFFLRPRLLVTRLDPTTHHRRKRPPPSPVDSRFPRPGGFLLLVGEKAKAGHPLAALCPHARHPKLRAPLALRLGTNVTFPPSLALCEALIVIGGPGACLDSWSPRMGPIGHFRWNFVCQPLPRPLLGKKKRNALLFLSQGSPELPPPTSTWQTGTPRSNRPSPQL